MDSTSNRGGRRLVVLLLVLTALGLCTLSSFGLLATLEPSSGQHQWLWRALYASVGLGGLALMVLALFLGRRSDARRP